MTVRGAQVAALIAEGHRLVDVDALASPPIVTLVHPDGRTYRLQIKD